ncbi:hypothetical protein [Erwinia sp.]|uniref:hypothetical protein n=1 Tax=Erwinia citreus TaxID=558 RepID=UPI0028A1C036|nr:hypothetical protein [Erwinia sp.]
MGLKALASAGTAGRKQRRCVTAMLKAPSAGKKGESSDDNKLSSRLSRYYQAGKIRKRRRPAATTEVSNSLRFIFPLQKLFTLQKFQIFFDNFLKDYQIDYFFIYIRHVDLIKN